MIKTERKRINVLDARSFMRNTHTIDVLQDHLSRARASGGVFARSVACPPWGLQLSSAHQLAVHAVVQGRAWLWTTDARTAIELAPGDLALVRGGPDHYIAHAPAARCLTHEQFLKRHFDDERSQDRRATVFLCGAYRFSGDIGRGLLDALPAVLPLSATADDPLHDVIALVSRELTARAPGQQTVLDRLLDVLLVLAIRACFDQSNTAPRWYHAAVDPRLGPALRAMHADATHPWTVTELASISGLSRAAFARHFQSALGQAPMQYLTDWRMTLARDHLRTGDLTITQIADHTGYTSPYAFAAAFRRHHGQPPGRWRAQHLTQPGTADRVPTSR
jgi:AraC-like DNA-binding protein